MREKKTWKEEYHKGGKDKIAVLGTKIIRKTGKQRHILKLKSKGKRIGQWYK